MLALMAKLRSAAAAWLTDLHGHLQARGYVPPMALHSALCVTDGSGPMGAGPSFPYPKDLPQPPRGAAVAGVRLAWAAYLTTNAMPQPGSRVFELLVAQLCGEPQVHVIEAVRSHNFFSHRRQASVSAGTTGEVIGYSIVGDAAERWLVRLDGGGTVYLPLNVLEPAT